MSKKELDIKYGLEKETELKPIIENYFNTGKLNKSLKYGIIDFYNKKFYFELKSRRITYLSFTNTIIGKNKIDFIKKLNQQSYLLFYFIDGLYYIKYDENLFNQFEIKEEYIIRDGKKENKINVHIPIKYLNKII